MGSFFGPPIRVGIPIGIGAGFGHQVTPAPPPSATYIVTIGGDNITTLAADKFVTD
jgi:hypothetical protein